VARPASGVVRMGLSLLSPEDLAAWVRASCQSQGVPARITDPGTLARVVVLLGGGIGDGPSDYAARERDRPGVRLDQPHGLDTVGV
jgi:hypothetical protein